MLGINIIDITEIHPSPMNHRTVFIEESLQELANSIATQGVIEPIMVRPSKIHEGKYEIVCGERRYRSSMIAQQSTIPAMIRDLTDDEALDIMITENLQRRDISPMEEAVAFLQLIERRKITISELAARFGKSEIYIRNRLRLNELIDEFRALIKKDLIPVSHGLELCKLDAKIQQDLYNSHYQEDNWNSWLTITSKELVKRINNISVDFEDALFSTLDCEKCTFNSRYSDLFCDKEKCTNKFCFETKNVAALTKKALKISNKLGADGIKCVFFQHSYAKDNVLSESIKATGIPVFDADFYDIECPPNYPERYNNEADENYAKRLTDYQKRLDRYEKLPEQGYVPAVNVYKDNLDTAYYVRQKQKDLNFANSHEETVKELLKKKDREFELELINTFDDLKQVFNLFPLPDKQKLTPLQNDILCYAMLKQIGESEYHRILPNLRLDHAEKQGVERVLKVIQPLNEKMRFKITMLFIKVTLSNYGLNNQLWRRTEAEVFLRFAGTVYPDQTEETQKIRKQKREKRIASIDEQINSLKE
ncbi:ParB/RepB/Spo0J family partition protein [uncultured Parabacteroides sp.]|uniref:ParB/RepB/Spo0J family partition protein n=1 Tax=uncultured Parabacteroides sp. TaxID=512312 RepID=UPI00259B4931|nr:ParB/RepB/Spo0J family partition protein [uncultured Parabacteroides sp.]